MTCVLAKNAQLLLIIKKPCCFCRGGQHLFDAHLPDSDFIFVRYKFILLVKSSQNEELNLNKENKKNKLLRVFQRFLIINITQNNFHCSRQYFQETLERLKMKSTVLRIKSQVSLIDHISLQLSLLLNYAVEF